MRRISYTLALLILTSSLVSTWQASGATIIQASGSSQVAFEAEANNALFPGTPTSWVNTNNTAASGGGTLYITGTTDNGTSPHSFAQYQIKFATAGTYYLYYRWRADPARTVGDQFTANSCWIPNIFGSFTTPGADSQANFHPSESNPATQAPANNTLDWQRETEANAYTVTAEQVSAGAPLIFTVGSREAGMEIDRWAFSTDATLTDAALDATSNSDTDVVAQGAAETFIAFEAESKNRIFPGTPTSWVNTNNTAASGGGTLYITGTTDNGTSPHSFAQYQIKFATAGTYYLYYRWRADPARTVGDQFTANSCWIPNTFGSFTTPGADSQANFHPSESNPATQAPANNTLDWQRETEANAYTVTAEQVSAGAPLIFTVGSREAGMEIDRWVFSTDASLTDAALDALPNSGAQVAAPQISKAVGSAALNTVRLSFTRPLAAASVTADKFTLSGGVAVTGATLDPADPRQVTLTTAAQTQGTVYAVTVNGVTDTSGTAIAPNSTANFTAWKVVDGWATVELYQGVVGATLDILKSTPAFVERTPTEVRWVKGFQLNNDPRAPNMGARLNAFFAPPATGAYKFYVNNDDEGELFLSSDQSAANLASLNIFALSPPVFDDAIFAQSPSLTSGQKYLLEGLVQSGGADVFLNVAAQPDSSSTPATNLSVLSGSQISTFVNPDLGNVTFTEQPASATATEGGRARFSVKVQTSEQPVYYQWKLNGNDIPGATRSAFVTPVLAQSDTGKKYTVVVSVAGKDTTSNEATLTVTAGDPPSVQPYIGINFVGGGDNLPGPLTPVDVAGVVLQENWNNLTGSQFDQVPLRDSGGAASPVTLSAQATEHWYCGTLASGDANGVLLQGFLSTGALLDPFNLTLNGVPAGNYNLLVYSVGFPFQASYEEDVGLTGGAIYPTYNVKAETGLDYNANPAFRRMASTDPSNRAVGNYVQFDNVSPAGDGSLMITVTWASTNIGNTHQPAVNGIQLVRVSAVTARPSLAVTGRQGSTLTLSWGASASGFVLETSLGLGSGANWTPVTGAPNPISAAGTFDVPIAGSAGFYRLRK